MRGNLPTPVSSFVGRRSEVSWTRHACTEHRLVTIVGAGGFGKTRLSLEVGQQLQRSYRGGTWFVDLGRLPARRTVVDHTASVLRLTRETGAWTAQELTARLSEREMLIIFDNCEHVVEEVAELVQILLEGTIGIVVLATSRQALKVGGEQLLQLEGLALPPVGSSVVPAELIRFESVALFVERARSVLASFELTEGNAEQVVEIVRRLEGMPLAIELAAVRIRVLSPHQIAGRLQNQFRLLSATRGLEERHQTLRATIDWSYQLCSSEERLCWARLAVFPADFDIDAAEVVASGGEISQEDVLDLVGALVDKSVLRAVITGDGDGQTRTRYRLPETVREYGRERLEPSALEKTTARHSEHFTRLADIVPDLLFGPGQAALFSALRTDRPNLEAALSSAILDGDVDAADSLACAIALVAFAEGSLAESAEVLESAARVQGNQSTARILLLWLSAWVAINQGDLSLARSRAGACRSLAQLIGDRQGIAYAEQYLGQCELLAGDIRAAERFCEQAVLYARSADDKHLLATSLVRYAQVLEAKDDRPSARAALKESIATSEAVGETWCRGFALWNLALVDESDGEAGSALESARAALVSKDMFEDVVGAGQGLEVMAWCAAQLGDQRRAAVLLGAAQRIWRSSGAVLPAPLLQRRARCEEGVRAALGASEADTLRRQGEELLPRDAVAWDGESTGSETVTTLEASTEILRTAFTSIARSPLTSREREVALLVARGMRNREIADQLVISVRTAEAHIDHILSKLEFTSRSQISAWVAQLEADSDQ